jgi:hypothetical protein
LRDVPNANAWVVDVYSVAGPIESLQQTVIDWEPVTFSGDAATGYFADHLWRTYQLGATPEASALAPHTAGAPGWDASSKLSGKAAIGWSAIWPKNGKVFGSGFPRTGAVWRGSSAATRRQLNCRAGATSAFVLRDCRTMPRRIGYGAGNALLGLFAGARPPRLRLEAAGARGTRRPPREAR